MLTIKNVNVYDPLNCTKHASLSEERMLEVTTDLFNSILKIHIKLTF